MTGYLALGFERLKRRHYFVFVEYLRQKDYG